MNLSQATIKIRNLRVRTYIGFNNEERIKQQDVIINMEINHQVDPGTLQDKVSSALNYKTITKAVIEHVEQGRFLLLEKLVTDVVEICARDPRVEHCRVTIDKPHALRFADSVSVTLEHCKDAAALRPIHSKPHSLNLVGNAS